MKMFVRPYRWLWISFMLLLGTSVGAAVQRLEGIVAVVDDDIVLASELNARLVMIRERFSQENAELPPEEVLVRQVLERLILDSILLQMGRRAGIRISDEQLTNAINEYAVHSGLSPVELQENLRRQNISYKAFREQVRRDIIIRNIQQNQVMSRIYITPQEVQDFLASPLGQQQTSDEYHVGHILIAVPSTASDDEVERARNEARSLHRRLNRGVDFRELAIAHSDDSRALEGGDLGWRKITELPSLIVEQIPSLKAGEVASPIRSPSGFHIISLFAKRGITAESQAVSQVNVRHILVRPSQIRNEAQTEQLIKQIRTLLEAGNDFGRLAEAHSEDPGSALTKGELGWILPDTMEPEFAQRARTLPVNQLSQPFRTQFGWHIMEVLERREQDMSKEFLEREAIRQIRNRRYEEELQVFLNEIRNEAYIEIRI